MNVCLCPLSSRVALILSLLALIGGAVSTIAPAGDFDCGSDIVPIDEDASACQFELAGTEELCMSADLDTDESVARVTLAKQVASQGVADQSGSPVEDSVAAIATAALASAGVSIQQIIEPFAMVGPYIENSLESVRKFERWWEEATAEQGKRTTADQPLNTATPNDIQRQLAEIAAQEPVDAEWAGPSVLVDRSFVDRERTPGRAAGKMAVDMLVGSAPVIATLDEEPMVQPGIKVTAIDMLVGGSPIIATLDEESDLPYDFSTRDIKLWSVFPLVTRPFCVRSHVEEMDASPMWQEFDDIVVSQSDRGEPNDAFVCNASADCLLEELIWNIECWTADDSPLWATLTPGNIGKHVASLVSGGNRLIEEAAHALASRMPEAEESQPSAAGQALLARAGAVHAAGPVDAVEPACPLASPEAQLVEVPSARQRY